MSKAHMAFDTAEAVTTPDGFAVLDACHRQTLVALGKLSGLLAGLDGGSPDAQARAMAAEIVRFFSTTARQHHEDEERHVFPGLLTSGDPDTVQTVQRLQQDHHWLEQDWLELEPLLDAVANGLTWYDLAALREGSEIFTALSHEHVELEESCIYPQARTKLGAGERREMGREMAARRQAERDSGSRTATRKTRG